LKFLAPIDVALWKKLDGRRAKYSIQKYFDYKSADKIAKCRICKEKIEKAPRNIDYRVGQRNTYSL
jgi:hypothetical protein